MSFLIKNFYLLYLFCQLSFLGICPYLSFAQFISTERLPQSVEGVIVFDTVDGEKSLPFTLIGPYNLTTNSFPLSILTSFMAKENCESKVEYTDKKTRIPPSPTEEAIYQAFDDPEVPFDEILDRYFKSPCPGQTDENHARLIRSFQELYKIINLFYRTEKVDFFELTEDLRLIVGRKNIESIIFLLGDFYWDNSAEIELRVEENSLLYIKSYFNEKLLKVSGEGEAFLHFPWEERQGPASFDLPSLVMRTDSTKY